MSIGRRNARVAASIPKVRTFTGVFVEMSSGLAVVNVGEETITVPCAGWYPPVAGQPVLMESLNGAVRVVGPARALSPRGTVTGAVGTDVTVSVDGEKYTMPRFSSYSPVVGDVVAIDWAQYVVSGKLSATPAVVPPATGGNVSTKFSNLVIQAVQSGRWFGSAFKGEDVWASPSNKGAWFYGSRLSALSGADISRVEIYLPLSWAGNYGGGDQSYIGVHGSPTRPGTMPSLSSQTLITNRSGWVSLPTAWGNFFRDTPTAGLGAETGASGFWQWAGVPSNPMSGALRFAGTR